MNTQNSSTTPLISVIIPVFNVEKYLSQCIDSILSQKSADIEIICINDGSTDSSANILTNYRSKNHRIKIITQDNKGLSEARNVGLQFATGKYIHFMDSDDWIKTDFYEMLKNKTDTDADIIQCGYYKSDNPLIAKCEKTGFYDTIDDICNTMNKTYVWNKLWKRDFIVQNNLTFYPKIYYEDILFHIEALMHRPKWLFTDYSGYIYNYNSASITNDKTKESKRCNDKFFVVSKAFNLVKNSTLNSKEQQAIVKMIIRISIGAKELSDQKLWQKYNQLLNSKTLQIKRLKFILKKMFNPRCIANKMLKNNIKITM